MSRGVAGRSLQAVAIAVALQLAAGHAPCDTAEPQRSVVALARADRIMVRDTPLAPAWLYPEGRIDFAAVDRVLRQAVADAVGTETAAEAWRQLLTPTDRVAIQFDVKGIAPRDVMLEALIRQIMDAGVPLRNIIIYAGDETELFRAGFDLSGRAPGARVMSTDALGYRRGVSRLVLEYCSKIINLSRLRVDPDLVMYGALANCLESVPYVERARAKRDPVHVAEAASGATLRRKTVLHIVHALRPGYALKEDGRSHETWDYLGVLASVDPVALDAVANDVLQELREEELGGGVERLVVPYLQPAAERLRLGNLSPERIEIVRRGPSGD